MPANYFHLLRRQMLRNYRKPLVLATPKIGLKHPMAVSPIKDFIPGTKFQPVYSNQFGQGPEITKVLICSGKVYFDICQKLEQAPPSTKVLVIRLEELAPFPMRQVEAELRRASKNAEIYYMQEECMNQGAFQFAKLYIDRMIRNLRFNRVDHTHYIGRPSQHSFATGAQVNHKKETVELW